MRTKWSGHKCACKLPPNPPPPSTAKDVGGRERRVVGSGQGSLLYSTQPANMRARLLQTLAAGVAAENVVLGHTFLTHQFEEFFHFLLRKTEEFMLVHLRLCLSFLSSQ